MFSFKAIRERHEAIQITASEMILTEVTAYPERLNITGPPPAIDFLLCVCVQHFSKIDGDQTHSPLSRIHFIASSSGLETSILPKYQLRNVCLCVISISEIYVLLYNAYCCHFLCQKND